MTRISIDDVLGGRDAISQVRSDGDEVYWLARIAAEDGRTTIRRWSAGTITEVTPSSNVRSRVMEYGGGAYDVASGLVAWVDDVTRQVMVSDGGEPRALTSGDQRFRFGGLHLVPGRRLLLAVREDHAVEPEERTEIVALNLDSDNRDGGRVLVTGADFYGGIAVHGDRLAWFEWNHPSMSWDSASVRRAPLDDPASCEHIAGGDGVSALHPTWFPDGSLAWVSDESGFWNWTRRTAAGDRTWRVDHDCSGPVWVLDAAVAAPVGDELASVEFSDGVGSLTLWDTRTGEARQLLPGIVEVDSVAASGGSLVAIVCWPDRPESLVRLSGDSMEELVSSEAMAGAVAPTSRWADGPAGPVQSWFYSPATSLPPLLVLTHGGPTSATSAEFDISKQFWVDRGFAVLDVNYSGSTGFGRAYRERLKGQWGILDVADVVAAVHEVVNAGLVDPERVAIAGGSAGGYTTLQALVTSDVFAAGMSSYGIADLRTLATDTHKAESRYPDGLVGPWPEAEATYLERSPITQLDRLNAPMLILQGLDDKVVPPNQAYAMAEAVRAKGMPLALVTFEGEGHGFRGLAARRTALEAKLSFLEQVFGLPLSDDVPTLAVERLER